MKFIQILFGIIFIGILDILFSCQEEEIFPPQKIENVSAVVAGNGDGNIVISWDNSSSVISYNIYWSESSGVTTENGT